MITETEHYQFPLPSADNALSHDVERIRQTIIALDAALWAAGGADAATITAIESSLSAITPTVEALDAYRRDAYLPTSIGLTYDATHSVVLTETATIAGQNRVTQFARDAAGRVVSYDITYLGITTRHTITWDALTGQYLGQTSEVLPNE
ncbi:hypothetical protein [Ostreibacterium oceani]|uniref:Uncharacterized protein n=1 Tax=Ostreibacterium oceani TaxID=2654998 RepID=A0A6N7EWI3_9GAMM|nr:hypothetical protein [Ostreibacterium oceani]MPV86911.1 hypothetical protein [Ostreibacterium oceani]